MARVSSQLIKEQKLLEIERKTQSWQITWRAFVSSCLALSLFLLIILPKWSIDNNSQIQVVGNQLVSSQTIYELLPLSYPRSIWQIPTHQLSKNLELKPPIIAAKITRQLLPPRLIVAIEERIPIAFAVKEGKVGFLDKQGNWIAKSFYQNLQQSSQLQHSQGQSQLPSLKVIGFNDRYRSQWQELYELIINRSIEFFEVNWQDPNNLIVKTELGTVYLGSCSSELSKKFTVLDRLRDLSKRFNTSEIVYIDISNPDSPVIQRKQKIKAPAN
jgi:cell division protein FtsQ